MLRSKRLLSIFPNSRYQHELAFNEFSCTARLAGQQAARLAVKQYSSQSGGQNNFEKLCWFPACLRFHALSLSVSGTAAAGSFHHWLPFWLFGKTIHKFTAAETAAPQNDRNKDNELLCESTKNSRKSAHNQDKTTTASWL